MRKFLRTIYNGLVLVLIGAIIFLNFRLYHVPEYTKEQGAILNKETLDQLQFLKEEMKNHAAGEMQAIFPEGFVFTTVFYGLAWCAFAKNTHQNSDLRKEAISEAHWALDQIYSEKGKAYFQKDLQPSYGIFYAGWSNFLHAQIIELEGRNAVSNTFEDQFLKNSQAIADAFQNTNATFLPSYQGAAWPADNLVAISSLKLHHQLYGGNVYSNLIEEWLTKVKKRLDPETGLIPHEANPDYSLPRGSSQSLMLGLLPMLDESFALDQFKRYRKNFLTYRFGLPGIREYPFGKKGNKDIDSGPLALGVGGAASIFGNGTMTIYGERDLAKGLSNAVEAFGFSITLEGKKRYLNGELPALDAFIAYAHTRTPHFTLERENYDFQLGRLRFHGWSVGLILLLLLSKRFLRALGRFLDKRQQKTRINS